MTDQETHHYTLQSFKVYSTQASTCIHASCTVLQDDTTDAWLLFVLTAMSESVVLAVQATAFNQHAEPPATEPLPERPTNGWRSTLHSRRHEKQLSHRHIVFMTWMGMDMTHRCTDGKCTVFEPTHYVSHAGNSREFMSAGVVRLPRDSCSSQTQRSWRPNI